MATEREIFDCSGPLHLTGIDWHNPNHRRSVAASLVQGVYVVERDRQENRHGHNAQASPWWEFFNFQLIQVLVDPDDQSFFGCIYQLKNPNYHHQKNFPKFVVAFRGTINRPGNRTQDFKLDLQLIMNNLHQSSRFRAGSQCVQTVISKTGSNGSDIWLAGHSLGSAIALLIGRDLVKIGFHLETYLFNPPFTSLPFNQIKNEKFQIGARFATSIITAGLAAAVKITAGAGNSKQDRDREFDALSAWVPYLFVNPADPICSEYIGHFEHREKMVAIAGGTIGKLAAQNSIASILTNARGNECDAFHLLPSAYVTTNVSTFLDFKQNHGVHQWWRTDIHLACKLHQFRN